MEAEERETKKGKRGGGGGDKGSEKGAAGDDDDTAATPPFDPKEFKQELDHVINKLQEQFNTIRIGRAVPG